MPKVKRFIKKHWAHIILWSMIVLYIGYFSFFTILRYRTLYASYFDLGIMHQTVYNTFQSIKKLDMSRFLELTNPFGSDQIKRMAIHNDILLAFVAPFYFIHSGPETLLVIQTIVLALGGIAIFNIANNVFGKNKKSDLIALAFVSAHLLYPPMQRANIFEFHAVALATTTLLFMFSFWLNKRYRLSLLFFVLSILAKEQVALTTLFFGLYILYNFKFLIKPKTQNQKKELLFALSICLASLIWFAASMFIIIPYFRGGNHFALNYYTGFWKSFFQTDTLSYFVFLLGPTSFLSLLSPLRLLIVLPEFGINLLSNNGNMRNIVFHYTSVIQPFVFISAIYGAKKLYKVTGSGQKLKIISTIILLSSLLFSYFKSPLPYSRERDVHPFLYPHKERTEAASWKHLLEDDELKISTTGHMAPLFSSRRYFYHFSKDYYLADYVVLNTNEIYNYPEKDILVPVYEKLRKDRRFSHIYKNENLEVYKKL